MTQHPSIDELSRWRRGDVEADRVLAIAEHLAGCRACVALGTEQLQLDRAADALFAEAVTPQQPPRFWSNAIAASIAFAVLGTAMMTLMPRPSRVPVRVAEPVAESTPASQRPTTPGHARAEWDTLLANVRAGMLPEMPQALRSVRQPEEILRGGATAVQLTPTGIVVKAVRPQFRWPVRTGARSTVIVFRGEVEVLRSGPLTSARWTPSRDLERGVSYAWQVNIETDDDLEILPSPPAPPARFHVLDARTLAELQAAERFHPNDHLLLGILCARAGLDSEARGHLQRVTLPGDVGAARRLVREIESWRLQ